MGEKAVSANIPEKYRKKYEEIESMIKGFCKEYLDEEYFFLCVHALQKLCRKHTEPMSSGRNNMWAAGIVYAIVQNTGLVGKRYLLMGAPKYNLSTDKVASFFGVSKGGMSEKAKGIRKELAIIPTRDEWLVPSLHERNAVRKELDRMLRGRL
jgi:hypothetical protein